jgi:hypothetical protein
MLAAMKPLLAILFASLTLSAAAHSAAGVFPPPSELPLRPDLPDPRVARDGKAVTSAREWNTQRRPELKALFQHYMYGHLPPPPRRVRAEMLLVDSHYLDGQATLKQVVLSYGPPEAPRLNLLLVVPNQRRQPAPVILGVNFCGNHAVISDPRIVLPSVWMPNHCPGCTNHAATAAGRGQDAKGWDLVQAVSRGYAVATFYHGDLDPDDANATTGIRALARRGGLRGWLRDDRRGPVCPACPDLYATGAYDWSTISAWAWGFHRAVDYLVTERSLDRRRIAVFGHSRNGKTALLAGAFDERIGLVLCHQAGCGGSAPSRGKIGESVKQINDRFPHWFNAAFKEFNEQPERLPFDQHALIALCAPRPVLLSNATEDTWANPAGQFEMLQAADSVYRLLGVPGLGTAKMPAPGELVPSRLGYFLRSGKHSTTTEDWRAFLDFADAQWGPPGGVQPAK